MLNGKKLPPLLEEKIRKKIAQKRAYKMASMERKIDGQVDSRLADIEYCHEGYYILDKKLDMEVVTVKGECKDGATALGRKNFGITKYF